VPMEMRERCGSGEDQRRRWSVLSGNICHRTGPLWTWAWATGLSSANWSVNCCLRNDLLEFGNKKVKEIMLTKIFYIKYNTADEEISS
jgi:hypothetical protein